METVDRRSVGVHGVPIATSIALIPEAMKSSQKGNTIIPQEERDIALVKENDAELYNLIIGRIILKLCGLVPSLEVRITSGYHFLASSLLSQSRPS